MDWIHDDITWCIEKCPVVNCYRNAVNMKDKHGVHSYAMFKGTEFCPSLGDGGGCMQGCAHLKECFATCDSPDDAFRKLTDEYCDRCEFAEKSED